ncbi:MAG: hypothetical protein ABIO02_02125 [Patescibacteria group bacterium]
MIKKWFFVFFTLSLLLFVKTVVVNATEPLKIEIPPQVCEDIDGNRNSCLIRDTYERMDPPEQCALDYAAFLQSPQKLHFWAEDPVVTSQGKADERARQFIYWALNKNAIDDHPVLKTIWNTTSRMALIFIVVVAAIMGLGFMVAQRTNFELNIKVWPYITKLALALAYIFFSWLIVITFIQISEWVMRLFIDNLGGRNLFNIYINSSTGSSEDSYKIFVGCRDLNMRVQESADTQMWLFKLTNFTYYVMGVMLILRKILLWFLLFVSPFLALLMPFTFIRNIGWIWIGVFFQWLCYGPLFALFLGALNTIWSKGIPFAFDFSRTGDLAKGYIYPTSLILTYGGPGQTGTHAISALNSGNYVDTFVEYVIALIMLWAVIFFPWWLLRIFRDYCCDGIYAMKNILLSMYDQSRGAKKPSPTPPPTPSNFNRDISMKMPKEVDMPVNVHLETIEDIKKTRTEDISRSLNLNASKITDIARFETNKQAHESVTKTLNYLSNPTKAETPAERQKFMNIRNELFNRAIKDDSAARQILSATSSSTVDRIQKRQEILKTTSGATPITNVVSVKVQLPTEKVSSINNTMVNSITNNSTVVDSIAQHTSVAAPQVQTILTSFKGQTSQLSSNTITHIAQETGIDKQRVSRVIEHITSVVKNNKQLAKEIAEKENINENQLQQIVDTQIPAITRPVNNIEEAVSIPSTVSIEDYEEVKKMWTSQYEKGEVPESENVKSRQEWIDQDIIFISNTLNKLLSTEENLKNEGIDELGYILPIFILNNLKGDELMVYLKAKLEAAKAVKENIEREHNITARVKAEAEGEDLVDVDLPKAKEAEKELHMSEELETPNTPQTPSTETGSAPIVNPPSEANGSDISENK